MSMLIILTLLLKFIQESTYHAVTCKHEEMCHLKYVLIKL